MQTDDVFLTPDEEEAKRFVLLQPREIKLDLLKSALIDDDFGLFLKLTKILLDAPINEGGMHTEDIEEIRSEFYEQ